jgi:hypothetical protein
VLVAAVDVGTSDGGDAVVPQDQPQLEQTRLPGSGDRTTSFVSQGIRMRVFLPRGPLAGVRTTARRQARQHDSARLLRATAVGRLWLRATLRELTG